MGMYGEWLRVSPADVERAKADLKWAYRLAEAITYAEAEVTDPAARRNYGTDKAWHALDFLLRRKGFPVSIVLGEEPFVDDEKDPEADWGYGAPRYLTPEQVGRAAAALSELTKADLIAGVEQWELVEAEIYPSVWDRPGELEWAVGGLSGVKTYFHAAAENGDAIICWVS